MFNDRTSAIGIPSFLSFPPSLSPTNSHARICFIHLGSQQGGTVPRLPNQVQGWGRRQLHFQEGHVQEGCSWHRSSTREGPIEGCEQRPEQVGYRTWFTSFVYSPSTCLTSSQLRKTYRTIQDIKKVSGWVWNDETGASITPDLASSWDDYVAKHPKAKAFETKVGSTSPRCPF